MGFELAVIVLLTLANGVFAAAELAIISIRKTRLEELVDSGSSRARAAHALRAEPERFLATVQIGITVIGATAAAFGGASVANHLVAPLERLGLGASSPRVAFILVVALISYLSLVLGELVPKSLALKFAEQYGLFIAKPVRALSRLTRPLVWVLTGSSNLLLHLFGDRTTFTESRISPDELQNLVDEAARSGSLNPRAGAIASRAFDMGELRVGEVMIPRNKIVALPRRATVEEIKSVLLTHGHSRMPVHDGSLDQIIGYVTAKDLLSLIWSQQAGGLAAVLRPAYFIPENKGAVDALHDLQQRRRQLALVVDERGGLSGLVTTEDLVEEVVGEIFSEFDQPLEALRAEPGGTFLIQGSMPIRDLNRQLALALPEGEEYSTLAGLILTRTGRIPEIGSSIVIEDGTALEVVDASARRVRCIRLRPPTPGP